MEQAGLVGCALRVCENKRDRRAANGAAYNYSQSSREQEKQGEKTR